MSSSSKVPDKTSKASIDVLKDVKSHERGIWLIKNIEELASMYYSKNSSDVSYILAPLRKEYPGIYTYLFGTTDPVSSLAPLNLDRTSLVMEEIKQATVIDINLAFLPSDPFVSRLYIWFEQKASNFLIRFNYDRSLLGGFTLVYAGKYFDFILPRLCSDLFKKNRNEILPIIQE